MGLPLARRRGSRKSHQPGGSPRFHRMTSLRPKRSNIYSGYIASTKDPDKTIFALFLTFPRIPPEPKPDRGRDMTSIPLSLGDGKQPRILREDAPPDTVLFLTVAHPPRLSCPSLLGGRWRSHTALIHIGYLRVDSLAIPLSGAVYAEAQIRVLVQTTFTLGGIGNRVTGPDTHSQSQLL